MRVNSICYSIVLFLIVERDDLMQFGARVCVFLDVSSVEKIKCEFYWMFPLFLCKRERERGGGWEK